MFDLFNSKKKGYLTKEDIDEMIKTYSNEVESFEIDNIFNFLNPGTG